MSRETIEIMKSSHIHFLAQAHIWAHFLEHRLKISKLRPYFGAPTILYSTVLMLLCSTSFSANFHCQRKHTKQNDTFLNSDMLCPRSKHVEQEDGGTLEQGLCR